MNYFISRVSSHWSVLLSGDADDHLVLYKVALVFFIIGHALHEKGLQWQIGVGTLVSSQERRALAAPLIKNLLTAGQMRINRWFRSGIGLHRISLVRASEDTFNTIRWRARSRVLSKPNRPDDDCPTQPRLPSPPGLASPRSDGLAVCPDFSRTCTA